MAAPSTRRGAAVLVMLAVAGCGSAELDRFDGEVAPVLERHCLSAACHGVLPDAEERGEVIDWEHFHVRVRADGRIADPVQARDNVLARVNTIEAPELSTLLRKPLAAASGGLPHVGGTQFSGADAEDYRVLRDWIASQTGGGEGAPRESLTDEQAFFAEAVLPHLQARQCLNRACHGRVSPFTAFEPPVPIGEDAVFSTAALVDNYRAARVHLHLGGDPGRSRLLRKGLPIDRGGIPHRGGNDIFFGVGTGDIADDPAVSAILEWADMERRAALGPERPAVSGIVFVRGPVAAERPFSHQGFAPGSDLYVLEPPEPGGQLRNLTASAHPGGPADVRDPAVRHDGQRIAFAMRTGAGDAFNIYDIGVDGGDLRQHTSDDAALPGGGIAANVQPTWGPDGRIYFASTRAGILADEGDVLDTDVWAVDPDTGALERFTRDPAPQVTPSFIGTGKTHGTLAFTVRRTIGERYEGPVFRVPIDRNHEHHADGEIHIHHGVTADGQVLHGMRTLPDGRHPAVLLERDNLWRAGSLAVVERQFGPEIPRGAESEAAVGGFRHAIARVDPDARAGGISDGGAYRHPAPLPDGGLVAAFAPGPIDLSSPEAAPDFGLYVLELEETAGGPRLGARRLLLDEAGVAEYDPEPIARRPLEDDPDHEPGWDPARQLETGTLSFRHVETLEAIQSSLPQLGPKQLRQDLTHLRLVAAVSRTPLEAEAAPVGLGGHGPEQILAEVPLQGGSVYLEVPAEVPFRVQYLDRERRAVGAQHNRWIHVAPGESFPGGVSPELYPVLCAGCHGAVSGDPGDVGGPVPDAVTAASVTLATHENLDPRRPKDPVPVGDAPIAVDFAGDVGPVLEDACATAGCHAGAEPAGGLDLERRDAATFDTAYHALLVPGTGSGNGRRYVDADGSSARTSYLVELVYGTELEAGRAIAGSCPADEVLTADERLLLVRWIDLGAPYRVGAP